MTPQHLDTARSPLRHRKHNSLQAINGGLPAVSLWLLKVALLGQPTFLKIVAKSQAQTVGDTHSWVIAQLDKVRLRPAQIIADFTSGQTGDKPVDHQKSTTVAVRLLNAWKNLDFARVLCNELRAPPCPFGAIASFQFLMISRGSCAALFRFLASLAHNSSLRFACRCANGRLSGIFQVRERF